MIIIGLRFWNTLYILSPFLREYLVNNVVIFRRQLPLEGRGETSSENN